MPWAIVAKQISYSFGRRNPKRLLFLGERG